MSSERIQPLVLAAGQGTRMRSRLPKVLQPIGGKSMLSHVLDTCGKLSDSLPPILVLGHGADQIQSGLGDSVRVAMQYQQLGTGHAVHMAAEHLDPQALVLILYGDVPLISVASLERVICEARKSGFSLLTVAMGDPSGYGRIERNIEGKVTGIVEQKDANPQQLLINEINTGIMAISGANLIRWVASLSDDNTQGEYYLTDIVGMACSEGIDVGAVQPEHTDEVQGANDRMQLAQLERAYQELQVKKLMRDGAMVLDPNRIDVRGELIVAEDVVIDINAVFEGRVELGTGVVIEPNCYIKDSVVGAGSCVRAFSHLESATLASNVTVGPYARLRPGTRLADGVRIGNFVETKNLDMGEGSKANHLTYLGDTEVGCGSNIGAGTITCNYDGKYKHRTQIADDVFVGSNSALVAPVSLGEGATVAAGSVLTQDLGPGNLGIARGKQRNIPGWKRPDQKHRGN